MSAVGCLALVALAGFAGSAWAAGLTAYVVSDPGNIVTPITLPTNTVGSAIPVGRDPSAIAITPDGKTAYVTNSYDGTVTPIVIATNTPGSAIPVGRMPLGIAITPDGKIAYVTNQYDYTVTPITIATNTPGSPIPVGFDPEGIAITRDGETAYIATYADDTVTPITIATNTPGSPIPVSGSPHSIAITPNGKTAFVTTADAVTPITIATNTAESPIPIAGLPFAIAITPDGKTAYVVDAFGASVTPITIATNTPGTPIPVGFDPDGIAITPDGTTAYITNFGDSTVTPITIATNTPGSPIPVGRINLQAIAITPTAQRQTSTSVHCQPASVPLDQSTTCTATVTDAGSGAPVMPTGQVSFATDSLGSFAGNPCTLAGSGGSATCQVIYTPTAVGSGQHALTATFSGDNAHVGSSGQTIVAVALRATRTRIRCRPRTIGARASTVCTATVSDRVPGAPVAPSGLVTFASNKPGTFTRSPCTLSTTADVSSCQVSYTPAAVGVHELRARYSGDSANAGSRGRTILRIRCARVGPRSADRRGCRRRGP